MRVFRTMILSSILVAGATGITQALPFINLEAGMLIGTDIKSVTNISPDTSFTYGAYGRIWLKPGNFRIAPFFKWENIDGVVLNGTGIWNAFIEGPRNNNLQYGVLLGVEFFNISPYVGIAYSHFTDGGWSSTWALNYGLKFKIPILPFAIGIEGSWQRPEVSGVKIDMNRIGAFLAIQF